MPLLLCHCLCRGTIMEVCYSLHRRETIVAMKGMTMSRFIKSAETLKARVGKQVKVDGEIFNVSCRDETIKFDNEVHSFSVVDDPVCIGRFLRSHNVASAGYKFKHTSSSDKFILNKECRVTLKPYVGDFDDHSSCHTIVGMIRFCKDHCGDRGYMLLTNDKHLRGDPAADKKGYANSWWLGSDKESMEADVERTEPLAKPSEEFTNDLSKLPLNKPVKVQFKAYPGETYEGMFKRCHKTDNGKERIFFLSNHTRFDGCECVTSEREGYKYSWSMHNEIRPKTTTYEYKIVGDAIKDVAKTEEKEYSLCHFMGDESTRKTVKGAIKEYKGISYLLSNDEDFDGGHPDSIESTGYKYGWWLCEGSDISKSGYAIREACAESPKTSSKTLSKDVDKDPLVRIAMALEDIATYLSRMSKCNDVTQSETK